MEKKLLRWKCCSKDGSGRGSPAAFLSPRWNRTSNGVGSTWLCSACSPKKDHQIALSDNWSAIEHFPSTPNYWHKASKLEDLVSEFKFHNYGVHLSLVISSVTSSILIGSDRSILIMQQSFISRWKLVKKLVFSHLGIFFSSWSFRVC